MNLSLEAINAKSPYPLIRLTDMSFRFVTDQGLTYRVGFYADKYFMPNGAYHFYIANKISFSNQITIPPMINRQQCLRRLSAV